MAIRYTLLVVMSIQNRRCGNVRNSINCHYINRQFVKVTIKTVIYRGNQIQVGDSIFERDAVKILGAVTGIFTPIR